MKTWIIALPFLCAASAAMAQEVGAQPGAEPVVTPAERAAAQARPAAPVAEAVALPDKAAIAESRPAKAASKPATQAKASRGKHRTARRGPRSLPKGDVRHCLDLKTRAEVIRCSETRKRK